MRSSVSRGRGESARGPAARSKGEASAPGGSSDNDAWALAMRLVATGLSTPGYVTVATTRGLENVLDHTEGFVTRFDREREILLATNYFDPQFTGWTAFHAISEPVSAYTAGRRDFIGAIRPTG